MDSSQQHALKTVQTYDRLAQTYDRVSPVATTLLFGNEALALEQVLGRIDARPGEQVLDVCCGTGGFALALAPQTLPHGRVLGVDLSQRMLRIAQSKNRFEHVRFVEGNAEVLPFAPDSFERVCCTLTLHEMPALLRRNVLREMRRVTRAFGRVYILDWHLPRSYWRSLLLQTIILLSLRPEIGPEFLTGGLVGEVTSAGFVVEDFVTFGDGGLQLVVGRKV